MIQQKSALSCALLLCTLNVYEKNHDTLRVVTLSCLGSERKIQLECSS